MDLEFPLLQFPLLQHQFLLLQHHPCCCNIISHRHNTIPVAVTLVPLLQHIPRFYKRFPLILAAPTVIFCCCNTSPGATILLPDHEISFPHKIYHFSWWLQHLTITSRHYHYKSPIFPCFQIRGNYYNFTEDKKRLFDASIKKVKYEGTHVYEWALNNR